MPTPITPDLAPGAGWHRIEGYTAPGSSNDRAAMQRRAYHCYVLTLRYRGELREPSELLCAEPMQGALLMMEGIVRDHWDAHLFDVELVQHERLFLAWARLVRDHDGCRQYQGIERDHGKPRWPQTWLCAPTAGRALEIVQAMVDRKRGAG